MPIQDSAIQLGSRSPPGSTVYAVLANSDSRSSDVNLKNLVRGQDERNHAPAIREPKKGYYVTDRTTEIRGHSP